MILLLFVIKGDVLMKDTGPKQTFYVRTGGQAFRDTVADKRSSDNA